MRGNKLVTLKMLARRPSIAGDANVSAGLRIVIRYCRQM